MGLVKSLRDAKSFNQLTLHYPFGKFSVSCYPLPPPLLHIFQGLYFPIFHGHKKREPNPCVLESDCLFSLFSLFSSLILLKCFDFQFSFHTLRSLRHFQGAKLKCGPEYLYLRIDPHKISKLTSCKMDVLFSNCSKEFNNGI